MRAEPLIALSSSIIDSGPTSPSSSSCRGSTSSESDHGRERGLQVVADLARRPPGQRRWTARARRTLDLRQRSVAELATVRWPGSDEPDDRGRSCEPALASAAGHLRTTQHASAWIRVRREPCTVDQGVVGEPPVLLGVLQHHDRHVGGEHRGSQESSKGWWSYPTAARWCCSPSSVSSVTRGPDRTAGARRRARRWAPARAREAAAAARRARDVRHPRCSATARRLHRVRIRWGVSHVAERLGPSCGRRTGSRGFRVPVRPRPPASGTGPARSAARARASRTCSSSRLSRCSPPAARTGRRCPLVEVDQPDPAPVAVLEADQRAEQPGTEALRPRALVFTACSVGAEALEPSGSPCSRSHLDPGVAVAVLVRPARRAPPPALRTSSTIVLLRLGEGQLRSPRGSRPSRRRSASARAAVSQRDRGARAPGTASRGWRASACCGR